MKVLTPQHVPSNGFDDHQALVIRSPVTSRRRGSRHSSAQHSPSRNRAYQVLEYAIQKAKRQNERDTARALIQQRRDLPSQDPNDPHYRRLRYVRYADDWLLRIGDPDLKARIRANKTGQWDAIVTWAIDGAIEYNNIEATGPGRALEPTAQIAEDTGAWRAEADRILGFG